MNKINSNNEAGSVAKRRKKIIIHITAEELAHKVWLTKAKIFPYRPFTKEEYRTISVCLRGFLKDVKQLPGKEA